MIVKEECLAATEQKLVKALLRCKPTVLHFSGHGKSGGLLLQTEGGLAQNISSDWLRDLLEHVPSIHTVVLLGCMTGLSERTICDGYVKHAISVIGSLTDASALAFIEGFYSSFLAKGSIVSSFQVGKSLQESRCPVQVNHLRLTSQARDTQ